MVVRCTGSRALDIDVTVRCQRWTSADTPKRIRSAAVSVPSLDYRIRLDVEHAVSRITAL
jgi:hypothetical protein